MLEAVGSPRGLLQAPSPKAPVSKASCDDFLGVNLSRRSFRKTVMLCTAFYCAWKFPIGLSFMELF